MVNHVSILNLKTIPAQLTVISLMEGESGFLPRPVFPRSNLGACDRTRSVILKASP